MINRNRSRIAGSRLRIWAFWLGCSAVILSSCYGDPPVPAVGTAEAGRAVKPQSTSHPLATAAFARTTRNVLEYELIPSYVGKYGKAPFTTNRWGMRDKDYNKERPARTYRIALMGSVYAMAPGLDEHESFQAVLEDRLNTEAKLAGSSQRYEVLNFGVLGYSLLQQLAILDRKVWQFQPNALLLVLESNNLKQMGNDLIRLALDTVDIPFPEVKAAMQKAGVHPGMSELEAAARLRVGDIHEWSLRQIAAESRRRGVLPLAAVFPIVGREGSDIQFVNDLSDEAAAAGFTVLHVDDVFEGHSPDSLKVRPGNYVTAFAHHLMADALLHELNKTAGILSEHPKSGIRSR